MKKILFLLIVFFISTSSYSQIVGEDEVYLSGDLIDARFQDGGIENFHNYVIQNFDIKTVEKAGQILLDFHNSISPKKFLQLQKDNRSLWEKYFSRAGFYQNLDQYFTLIKEV
ncbi:MAG: hypothetical protein EOO46_21915 [Flavobacterium sp.]|nr:MAG: hypothetical protein EOO46_21915 [Flavobacterium sp.]